MPEYYAIQVRSGQEEKVKTIIHRCHNEAFKCMGIKLIIPKQKKNKGYRKDYPILPGYILLKCDELTNELYYQIKNTLGVTRVLKESISNYEIDCFIKKAKRRTTKQVLALVQRLSREKGTLSLMFNRLFKKNKVVKANLPLSIVFSHKYIRLLN